MTIRWETRTDARRPRCPGAVGRRFADVTGRLGTRLRSDAERWNRMQGYFA